MPSASDILTLLLRPHELKSLVKLKLKIRGWKKRAASQEKDADWEFCFDMLNKVSRSFAIVIEQLGDELRNAICVFYLVLRGLDTVEDDMAIDKETKTRLLLDFHNSIEQDGFTLSYGYKDEKLLLEKFDCVVRAYKSLKPAYQTTIKDITRRMAEGMQKFTTIKVETKADYDLYCHYVAGLVGIGLSKLFADSGLEDPSIADSEFLANHMGLFLQKTNIIRDFLEDHEDENEETGDRRVFWPKEIWSKHTSTLTDITFGKNSKIAVACLNEMVTDALQHVPYCLEYLSNIENEENFLFCAIPQVMAAHTLSLCYNNPKIFEGEVRKNLGECRNIRPVKLRKGTSARLMLEASDMPAVLAIFEEAMDSIQDRIPDDDGSAVETNACIQHVRDMIQQGRRSSSPTGKVGESAEAKLFKTVSRVAVDWSVVLTLVLIGATLAIDVPQTLLGVEQWSPLATRMEGSVPLHGVMTFWSLVFYAAVTVMLCSGRGQKLYTQLAAAHTGVSLMHCLVLLVSGASMIVMFFETAPRLLVGGCLFAVACRQSMQCLTPSHFQNVRRRISAGGH
mmetsp:Transcript_54565/g.111346  ORF Transcript_54565/g.111346 Transcript_54565/m.111346 type:complete len:565 (+) Transcript_54565:274-1968(+)|eukprot:CAMPEP_0181314566 /NCGR_PEP_ID=MMETSP1101-20121128/14891_1 /TAXON_ID=46948 /ORGANISM="Rhodomonas abbreviata, Strain Caron Lab Isolate" /LENGTH=564 /DNA_ID=CAMNT_0023421677 /DNA_START=260 /DNA_END=1954 /DNA_ORIENTATION=+